MPPILIKAKVRRRQNDAADTTAICKRSLGLRVDSSPIRTSDNRAVLMHHKLREILVSERPQLLNALRPSGGN